MTSYIKDIGRLVLKLVPFIISITLTSLIFLILLNYYPIIGTVSTEVIYYSI